MAADDEATRTAKATATQQSVDVDGGVNLPIMMLLILCGIVIVRTYSSVTLFSFVSYLNTEELVPYKFLKDTPPQNSTMVQTSA